MRKRLCIPLLASFVMLMTACSDISVPQEEEKVVPVEVLQVAETVRSQKYSFIGTVQPGKMIRYSFKVGGRIASLLVERGDPVKKGDTLASLEKDDLAYALQLAKSQLETVEAQYEKASNGAAPEDLEQARLNVVKARDAYQYAEERLLEAEQLYHNGTASKQVYDQARLERDIRASDLKLAEEIEAQVKSGARYEEIKALTAQLEGARSEYLYRQNQLNEAVLKSEMDGVVMEVLAEKGEIAGAGYPVVVLRDQEKKVFVGLPEKNLKQITMETEVYLEWEGERIETEILHIAEVPDELTGLYNIELAADKLEAPFGASLTVNFLYGSQKACFIPIPAIHSGNGDYVYTVSEGRAVRKSVTIIAVDNFEAGVTGLHEGDIIIISGSGRLSTGDRVTVKEGEHDSVD